MLGNCSVQTLNNWSKQDNAPPRNADGTYSARDYGMWLANYRGTKRRGRPSERMQPVAAGNDKNEAETRLKNAQAEAAERKNAVEKGLLIETETVETVWQGILMKVRSRLLQMPTSLAPILVGQDEMATVKEHLQTAVNDALSELADDWRDDEGDDDDD